MGSVLDFPPLFFEYLNFMILGGRICHFDPKIKMNLDEKIFQV